MLKLTRTQTLPLTLTLTVLLLIKKRHDVMHFSGRHLLHVQLSSQLSTWLVDLYDSSGDMMIRLTNI